MRKKILIVEDDQGMLALLKDLLENEGYEVTALSYTESIIKSIHQYRPELVMLDFLLPGINGGELCHDIKSSPETKFLPVIMLSGFPRVLESLGDYGADIFIAKPFEAKTLLQSIRQCFDSSLAIA